MSYGGVTVPGMATYQRLSLSEIDLVPVKAWRKGKLTVTFGRVAGDEEERWYVHRSDWPWAAVFPGVLWRDACDFGDQWIRKGWIRVETGSDSIRG